MLLVTPLVFTLLLLVTILTSVPINIHASTLDVPIVSSSSHPLLQQYDAAATTVVDPLLRTLGTTTCTNDCSGHGTCLSTSICQCLPGYFGKDCSITATSAIPIYSQYFTGRCDQKVMIEWRMVPNDTNISVPYLHTRWCSSSTTWFGGIFDVDWDGMTPVSGTIGDTWAFWILSTTSTTINLVDYCTTGRSTPDTDSQQDLKLVTGYRNDTFQCVEFTRNLDTKDDKHDIVISATPGSPARFMWTEGSSAMGSDFSSVSTGKHGGNKLTMHGYVGYTGQFRVDWAAGTLTPLNDGVKWPVGYYYALLLTLGLLVLPFGLLLNRDLVKASRWGRWLRKRPIAMCCGIHHSHSNSCWNKFTLQFFPSLANFSVAEITCFLIYILIVVVSFVTSIDEYDDLGRGGTYFFGHLLAIHMAIALFPVSRNSMILPLLNISFDLAIAWHRRLGYLTLILFGLHGFSMILMWDLEVIVYVQDCEFGMGSLFGSLSGLCFLALFFSSLECVRRSSWEWFFNLHVTFVSVGYVFGLLHSVNFRWLLLVPGSLFLIDVTLRWLYNPHMRYGGKIVGLKDSIHAPEIEGPVDNSQQMVVVGAKPSSGFFTSQSVRIVRLECHGAEDHVAQQSRVVVLTFLRESRKAIKAPSPGSHVYLRVPELSWLQLHPFSISHSRTHEADGLHQVFMTVHIRAMAHENGDSNEPTFTEKLFALASTCIPQGDDSITFDGWDGVVHNPSGRNLPFSVLLDGPYNSMNLPVFQYRVLVLVAGGIGVTPIMSLLTYYMSQHTQKQAASIVDSGAVVAPAVQPPLPLQIYFIWSSRNGHVFEQWFPNEMEQLKSHAARVKVQLYQTQPGRRRSHVGVAGRRSSPSGGVGSSSLLSDGNGFSRLPGNATDGSLRVSVAPQSQPHLAQGEDINDLQVVSISPPAAVGVPLVVEHEIQQGRPNFTSFFHHLQEDLTNLDHHQPPLTMNDVLVFSCGPAQMIDDAEFAAEKAGCAFTHEAFEF